MIQIKSERERELRRRKSDVNTLERVDSKERQDEKRKSVQEDMEQEKKEEKAHG